MSDLQLELSIHTALDHFDLQVEAEFYSLVTGIFGVSGAGKTSLFKCLVGLEKDVIGHIRFNDKEWLNSDSKRFVAPEHRRIGYVPQNGLLFPNKNVLENLTIASHRRQHDHAAVSLETVCQLLDLDGLLQRSTHSLSGGERQRVALGRAIYSAPDLLLLDEPLAALDLKLKRQILPFLQRIREELSIPMIMISHYPAEIQALCDEVLVLQQGKKIAFGPTQEVLLKQQVLELTHGEDYENVISTVVVEHTEDESNSVLQFSGQNSTQRLIVAKANMPVGEQLMVGIPANDIIIATQCPEGLSAQNILPATVQKIEQINGKYMVCAAVTEDVSLNAEINSHSLQSLKLATGDSVFLIIKSGSCILYSR